MTVEPQAAPAPGVVFPRSDGSRVPFEVYSSQAVYEREQERIFRGRTWSFLGLEAEILKPGDYKATFIGETPVVMTRTQDGALCAWVNRCAHRGAMLCRLARGNALSHSCVYHQWNYDAEGNLTGVPFRRGQKGMAGMPADFDPKQHGLRRLRVASHRGLVFATFAEDMESLEDYIGPDMLAYVDRVFCKPVTYLGCTRQYSKSNWKLYLENVKDPYHASLLHLFHTTFNIFRVGMRADCHPGGPLGLHSIVWVAKSEESESGAAYKAQNIRSYDEGFRLQDEGVLAFVPEYGDLATNHIQSIFPQLVIQQIHNTLVARQILPKGPGNFELIFHFFGYQDDTEEMRRLRIKQANLVGPAGYISMEDTEATELVQNGSVGAPRSTSVMDMARDAPEQTDTVITEHLLRQFWRGYRTLMDYAAADAPAEARADA